MTQQKRWEVLHGDCLDVMRGMADASVDAVVSDPPYGLGFMGKAWDSFAAERNEGSRGGSGDKGLFPGYGRGGTSEDRLKYRHKEAHAFQSAMFDFAIEALRIAKPGAHLLAFGGTRTFHRLAVAIEDAGWEIRDNIGWAHQKHLFCRCDALPYSHDRNDLQRVRQGVPDVPPATSTGEAPNVLPRVQRREPGPRVGDAREQGPRGVDGGIGSVIPREDDRSAQPGVEGWRHDLQDARGLHGGEVRASAGVGATDGESGRVRDGAPSRDGAHVRAASASERGRASPEPRPDGQHAVEPGDVAVEWVAQGGGAWPCCGRCGEPLAPPLFQGPLAWKYGTGFPKSHNLDGAWDGWGTALKPAWEPIIVARKPLVGTVARNVAEFGTGALNVDGCRIGLADWGSRPPRTPNAILGGGKGTNLTASTAPEGLGRWPANLILDEEAAAALDAQTGNLKAGVAVRSRSGGNTFGGTHAKPPLDDVGFNDSGGASRFFYVAKASRSERNAGLEGFPEALPVAANGSPNAVGTTRGPLSQPRSNIHPTVKPVAVMAWLCRLVTPPNGIVLDPFTGSGTTGVAALREGFRFVGIEREAQYVEIARARIANEADPKGQATLL